MHVNDNHWITIVMHTVKEEFQVLDSNSNGAISQRIRNMIATLVRYNFRTHMKKNIGSYIILVYIATYIILVYIGTNIYSGFVNLFQRAEISKDIMEANSTLESKKIPDVSSWPINEYKMPRQNDG